MGDPLEMYLNDMFTVTVNMAGLPGMSGAGRAVVGGHAARLAAHRPAVRRGDAVPRGAGDRGSGRATGQAAGLVEQGRMNDRADKPGRLNVSSGSPYEPVVGFSRAVRVGNIVAVGGTTAGSGGKMVGIGDPAAQTRAIIEIIAKALEDAGARLKDVIRTRHLSDRHRSLGGGRPRAWRSLRRDPARQ